MKSRAGGVLAVGVSLLLVLWTIWALFNPYASPSIGSLPPKAQEGVENVNPAPLSRHWWEVTQVVVCNTDGMGAYLRKTPGGERIVARPEGASMEALSVTEVGEVFFKVRDSRGNEGWVSGDYLCRPSESPPVATNRGGQAGATVIPEKPSQEETLPQKETLRPVEEYLGGEGGLAWGVDWSGYSECLRNRVITNPSDIYDEGDCRSRYLPGLGLSPEARAERYGSKPPVTVAPPAAPERQRPGPESPTMQMANVVRVIDGDTIDVVLNGASQRVRYYGNDTPESGEKCYAEATVRNRELIGGVVYLEPDARETDPYGRLLRYIYAQGGTFVDAQLIREGLAYAWTRDGKHRDYLMGLEAEARRNRVGCLWR